MDFQVQTAWPFLALLISLVSGAPLLLRLFRGNVEVQDYKWMMAAALPLYTLHQFEEYGIDLYGRHYQFYLDACGHLGFEAGQSCPIRPWHLGLVNMIFVNGAALRANRSTHFSTTGPCANFFGLAIVNGIIHLLTGIVSKANGGDFYNAGLLTGIFGLFPFGVMVLRALYLRRMLSPAGVTRAIMVGALANALLIASMPLRAFGYLGDSSYFGLGLLNLFGLLSVARPL